MKYLRPTFNGKLLSTSRLHCSWCTNGVDPPLPETICKNCHKKFKLLLSGASWTLLRSTLLKSIPTCWCQECLLLGLHVPAEQIDHVKPWRTFPSLFWTESNHRPLCVACHRIKTMTEE